MKKLIVAIVVLSFWVGVTICFADQGIPNMVGTWSVKSEGGVIAKNAAANAKTHHKGEFSKLDAEVVIIKQQGRVFHGTFTSPKTSESFVGLIGMDNKSIFGADEDGFAEGKILNKNKISFIYRHVTPADTVLAAGIWTRKK